MINMPILRPRPIDTRDCAIHTRLWRWATLTVAGCWAWRSNRKKDALELVPDIHRQNPYVQA